MRWLAEIKMPHPAQQITLQEYIHSVEENSERVDRLTEQNIKTDPHMAYGTGGGCFPGSSRRGTHCCINYGG